MSKRSASAGLIALVGSLIIAVAAVMLLRWLNWMPTVALTCLTVWVLVSIPIGIAVGHCVLEDEVDRPDDVIPDDITSPSYRTRHRPRGLHHCS